MCARAWVLQIGQKVQIHFFVDPLDHPCEKCAILTEKLPDALYVLKACYHIVEPHKPALYRGETASVEQLVCRSIQHIAQIKQNAGVGKRVAVFPL